MRALLTGVVIYMIVFPSPYGARVAWEEEEEEN